MRLTSLYGSGGGRIPTDTGSIILSRTDLTRMLARMSAEDCRAMHQAARTGDLATAQRLLREAAVQYTVAQTEHHYGV